jgi:DNA polymerase-1
MTNKTSETRLLIDGDILLYQSCIAVQQELCPKDIIDEPIAEHLKNCIVNNFITSLDGSDVRFPWSSLTDAITAIKCTISKYKTDLNPDSICIALSDYKHNFRKDVLPTYKIKRKGTNKPICYMEAVQYLKENYHCIDVPTLEADDVLGILATHPNNKKYGIKTIIISIDKDLQQIPGYLCNPDKDIDLETNRLTCRKITPYQAGYKFWEQTLTGDQTDGYNGCPNVGLVTAPKLLKSTDKDKKQLTSKEAWNIILARYKKAGLTKEDMIQQARVAKILHYKDYDFKKDKVKLFSI